MACHLLATSVVSAASWRCSSALAGILARATGPDAADAPGEVSLAGQPTATGGPMQTTRAAPRALDAGTTGADHQPTALRDCAHTRTPAHATGTATMTAIHAGSTAMKHAQFSKWAVTMQLRSVLSAVAATVAVGQSLSSYYVSPSGSDSADGEAGRIFHAVARAVRRTRGLATRCRCPKC